MAEAVGEPAVTGKPEDTIEILKVHLPIPVYFHISVIKTENVFLTIGIFLPAKKQESSYLILKTSDIADYKICSFETGENDI